MNLDVKYQVKRVNTVVGNNPVLCKEGQGSSQVLVSHDCHDSVALTKTHFFYREIEL